MPVKSLAKVQKKIISKKKSKAKALHENSRDSKRLHRAELREDRIAKGTSLRDKMNQPYYTRVAAFAAAAKHRDLNDPFTLEEVQDLILSFISRSTSELADLQAARRPGRPPTTRQVALEARVERENREYDSGMWVPDLLDRENVIRLAKWAGEWAALGTVKFVRVERAGTVKPSMFPPNGMS